MFNWVEGFASSAQAGITDTFFERMFNMDPSEIEIYRDNWEKIVPRGQGGVIKRITQRLNPCQVPAFDSSTSLHRSVTALRAAGD
jgi:hypothetical protein